MRFTLGLIFGVLLTIGVAYVVDSFHSAPGPDGKEGSQLVNWGVLNADLRGLSEDAQDAWARLVGGAKKLGKQSGA